MSAYTTSYPPTGTMPSTQAYGGGGGGTPPKKYVKIDGVMQLNPEYKRWKESQGQQATTAVNPAQALPVVSNMEDHAELNAASREAGSAPVPLSPATNATIDMMQEPDICSQVGVTAEDMVDGLGAIFAKYEAPIGLMNKLMCLSEYDELEFVIDDSGSMGMDSDTKDRNGRVQTRWEEAHSRMKSLLEILSYVPTPKISIRFLNRRDVVELTRSGQTPQLFLDEAYRKVDNAFRSRPSGSTPAKERLQESFQRGQGRRVSRYFFGDGCPNGGVAAQQAITQMVKTRQDPQGNPVTFLSCTNEDDQVEWMKEAEEVAPYCAEYDDFSDEAEEVRRDQGDALPYTMGFHLVGQLVGAMNPEDLDAMDESIPFTKWTLDNLLGIQTTEQEYRHYFDGFKQAQSNRRIQSRMDQVKKSQNWEQHYHLFLSTNNASSIPAVQSFKAELARLN